MACYAGATPCDTPALVAPAGKDPGRVGASLAMPGDRPTLSEELILATALRLIDRGGLAACTMRGVAAELGVQAMSLYWHVRDKQALLDGVIARSLRDISVPPAVEGDWEGGIVQFAHRFRANVLAHPHLAPLYAQRPAASYGAAKQAAAIGFRNLTDAGFTEQEAIAVVRTVVRFVIGFALAEAAARAATDAPSVAAAARDQSAAAPFLRAIADDDPDRLFQFGLDALMAGFNLQIGPR